MCVLLLNAKNTLRTYLMEDWGFHVQYTLLGKNEN